MAPIIRAYALLFSLCLLLQGCAGGAAGQLPFGTATHRLLESTEQLRYANPAPMELPRELNLGVLPAYYVEPGDVLLVQPTDIESPVRLPNDQTVLPDGTIELGPYGRLQVVGLTTEQIEQQVRQVVASQTPNAGPITVRLLSRQSKVFYILGEVNSPGAYPITGRETVLDAIIAGGGLTDAADQSRITYTQPTTPDSCRVVLPVCYREIVQQGNTSTNYQIGPGDRVFVPSKTLCQDIMEILHGRPDPGCPPCGYQQGACPTAFIQHVPPALSPASETAVPVPQTVTTDGGNSVVRGR